MLFPFLFDSTTCPANPYPLSFGYTPLIKLVKARPSLEERNCPEESTPNKKAKITLVSE